MAEYVTLVTRGGTPVRLANAFGVPYPTSGSGSLVFSDSATFTNPIFVNPTYTGDYTFADNLTVGGNATVAGTSNVAGAQTVGGALTVTGVVTTATNAIIGGYVTVAGNATITGSASVGTSLTVGTTLAVTGATTLAAATATSLNKVIVTAPASGATLTLANSSTFQTVGAYAAVLTFTAGTSVTFPTTGTLATRAGAEALTNKTYNGNTWTAGTGTLSIAAAKTLTASNTLTLAGTDGTTMTFPATTGTVATLNTANTFSANQIISVTDNTNAALRVTQLGTGNAILVEDATNPDATPFLVSATGQVVAGTTTAVSFSGGATPLYESVTTTQLLSGFGAALWNSTTTTGPTVRLAHSRGSTIGTHSVLSDSGVMGELVFEGSDGTGFIEGACIRAEVDGTPGTNDMPGRLMFATTADGAATRTDRWQINSSGYLKNLSGSFGRGAPVTKSNNFTVADTENWLINNKAGSTCTVTFPAASSWTGREIMFQNYENHTVVSASSNVVPLGGGAAGTALLQSVVGKWCTVVSDGTNWIVMQAG